MKIIKVMSKKVNGKEYSKYIINIPKEVVEESELLEKELKMNVSKRKITIQEKEKV
jgi:hypothetical protein